MTLSNPTENRGVVLSSIEIVETDIVRTEIVEAIVNDIVAVESVVTTTIEIES